MPPTPTESVTLYRKVTKEELPPYGLQKLETDAKIFAKPTLLCCGGLLINDNRHNMQEQANGFARIGHALLGYKETLGKDDPIDILSVSYPLTDSALSRDVIEFTGKRMKGEESKASAFAAEFTKQHLFPLIQDEAGNKRNLGSIKKGLRNITVLSHSYGALFIQQVGNVLAERMQELGMSEPEIRDATSQVVVLAAGPTAPLGAGKASFTTFNFINTHDAELRKLYTHLDIGDKPEIREMFTEMLAGHPESKGLLIDENDQPVHRTTRRNHQERLMGPKDLLKKPLNIMPIRLEPNADTPKFAIEPDSNEFAITVSPPLKQNALHQVLEAPSLNPYGMVADVRGKDGAKEFLPRDYSGHEPGCYFHYNLDKDGAITPESHTLRTAMSSVLTNSISNAIHNSRQPVPTPLPAAQDLVRLPKDIPYKLAEDVDFTTGVRAKGYNTKITEAFVPGLGTEKIPNR